MNTHTIRTTFAGGLGHELAARLDLPSGPVRAYALFAHCFTCTKDIVAARHIAAKLASLGIAALRFDFTGLGSSEGEFQNTNFSSNVGDLVAAADHLRSHYEAPSILIGHSLGGAAVIAAAHQIPEAKAVVTIGAPSDVAHVLHHFQANLSDIERDGVANVTLAGRTFPISRGLVEDAKSQAIAHHVANLRKAQLVMHAPQDQIVGIEHAATSSRMQNTPRASFLSTVRTICSQTAGMPHMPPKSLRSGRRDTSRKTKRRPARIAMTAWLWQKRVQEDSKMRSPRVVIVCWPTSQYRWAVSIADRARTTIWQQLWARAPQ